MAKSYICLGDAKTVTVADLWMQAVIEAGDDPEVRTFLKRHMREVHDFIAANETANMEPVRIRRAAPKAGVGRRVKFLERLGFAVGHGYFAPLPAIDPGYGRNSGPV